MNYYFVFPNSCAEFDAETVFTRQPSLRATNVGLVFDWWPPDDLFQSSPELFCTERLKYLLETNSQHFSGIKKFEKVERITTGSNWCALHAEAIPGHFWQITVEGIAMKDDFGLDPNFRQYVISERLLLFLGHNHVTEILGRRIEGRLEPFFEKYMEEQKRTNYSSIPPKLLKLDII